MDKLRFHAAMQIGISPLLGALQLQMLNDIFLIVYLLVSFYFFSLSSQCMVTKHKAD